MSLTVTATESTAMTAAVSLSVAARAEERPNRRSVRARRLRMRIASAKRPSDKIANAQPPGIDGQRRIDSAGAWENASIRDVESVHSMHLTVCVYYGVGGVSSANQRAADMRRSVQPDPAGEGCEAGLCERPLKGPGE